MVEAAAEHPVNTQIDVAHQEQLLREQQAGAGDEVTPAVGDDTSSDAGKEA
jgi:large subunit ribosomal protein L3